LNAIPSRPLIAFALLGIACSSLNSLKPDPTSLEPVPTLVRLVHQPIGRPIVSGDILVVRGVLQQCLAWRGRILDVVTVESIEPIRLLYAIDVSPIGEWPADIRDSILRFYMKVQPDGPVPRVTVEVFSSAEIEPSIWQEATISLGARLREFCPQNPPDPPAWWSEGATGSLCGRCPASSLKSTTPSWWGRSSVGELVQPCCAT
jgi:hypothetical protein